LEDEDYGSGMNPRITRGSGDKKTGPDPAQYIMCFFGSRYADARHKKWIAVLPDLQDQLFFILFW